MDWRGTATSKLKLCFRVVTPAARFSRFRKVTAPQSLSAPHLGRVSDASHGVDSLFVLAANVIAAGQEASSQATVGQSARTAASPSIASPLTSKLIESLRATANDPGWDYFIASREQQKNIVSAFVEDNSKSDPTSLYLAANTAYRIGELKEAAFSFTPRKSGKLSTISVTVSARPTATIFRRIGGF